MRHLLPLALLLAACEPATPPPSPKAAPSTSQQIHTDFAQLEASVWDYAAQHNTYPADLALLRVPLPRDPWGHDYHYQAQPGRGFTLLCLGSDGAEGGVGDAADTIQRFTPTDRPPTPQPDPRPNALTRCRADFGSMEAAIKLFKLDNGRYPRELDELWTAPADAPNWGPEPYLEEPPLDPWGRPYQYERRSGRDFAITSLGADGAPGGDGDAADISSRRALSHTDNDSKRAVD